MGVVEMSRLLLLSGGMDSVALAWHLRPELSLTIDYGQRPAEGEIRAAQAICEELHLRHKVLHIDCGTLGSGDLADKAALPVAPMPEWWPYRNQLLLTFAAGVAINEGTQHVVFGAVASDRSHADGRMEFFDAMNHVLSIQEGRSSLRPRLYSKAQLNSANACECHIQFSRGHIHVMLAALHVAYVEAATSTGRACES